MPRMSRLPRPARLEAPSLPRGPRDFAIQLLALVVALLAYQATRGLADEAGVAAAASARAYDLVEIERSLGLFFEPDVQRWAVAMPSFTDALNWVYLNVQGPVTLGGLLWIYLRHNPRYYFVRNMLFVSFLLACVGYAVLPTAPPRLMPEFGFVDTVELLTGPREFVWDGFANPYAAMPSMHIGFALMIGLSIARLCTRWWTRAFWFGYPAGILFVVIATGNHFWLDAVGGAVAAAIGALAAFALARARPTAWSWTTAEQPQRATT